MSNNISRTFGSQFSRLALAVAGAKTYAKELPKEAIGKRAQLESMQKSLIDLNTEQERAKRELHAVTLKLEDALTEAAKLRSGIVRLAEATFGPRDSRLREFRTSTGRTRIVGTTSSAVAEGAQNSPAAVPILKAG